jgi:hypothetical protein
VAINWMKDQLHITQEIIFQFFMKIWETENV